MTTFRIVAWRGGNRVVLGEVPALCPETALSRAHFLGITYSGLQADDIAAEPVEVAPEARAS